MKRFIPFMCALFFAVSADASIFDGIISGRSHAPQASKQVYDLTIHKDYSEPWYNQENEQCGFEMNNLDHTIKISLVFNMSYGVSKIEMGKKYTKYDIDESSFLQTYDTAGYTLYRFSNAEFTWTVDADSLNHFSGFVKDSLGNTYNFHYDEQAFAITGDTVQVVTTTVSSFSYSSPAWNISYYNENNYIIGFNLLSNNANSPAGTYNFAALNTWGNYLTLCHGHWREDIKFLDGKVNISESNDSTLLHANMLGDDGNVYAIYMYYSDPKPLYHVNFTADNLEIDSSGFIWGSSSFAAADSLCYITFNVSVDSTHNFYGTYTARNNIWPSLNEGENFIEIFSGSITISPSANGPVVTGSLLGRNDTEYTLNLYIGAQEAKRKDTIVINDGGLYIYNEQVKWLIWAPTKDSAEVVSLAFPGLNIEGSYTFDDLEARNSFILHELNKYGSAREKYRLLDANFTVTYDSVARTAHLVGTTRAKAIMHLGDICEYYLDITASYTRVHLDYDAPGEDFIQDFASYTLHTDYILSNHVAIIEANENNASALLYFYMPDNATEFLSGNYRITTSTPAAWTLPNGRVSDGELFPCYFKKTSGRYTSLWFPVEGNVTVDANKKITIEAINSYERTIRVTLNPKRQAISNINADKDAIKRIENGMVVIERNGVKYNILGEVIR